MKSAPDQTGPMSFNGTSEIPPRKRLRKPHFVCVFLLVLAPFIGAILFVPKFYYSAGTIIIGDQEPNAGAASPAWVQKLGDPADLESQLIIIKSRRLLRLALAKPGAFDAVIRDCIAGNSAWPHGFGSDCSRLKPASANVLAYVEGRYTVEAVGRSRVVAIGFRSLVPEASMMLANALLVSYLEDQRSLASGRNANSDWILELAKSGGQERTATASAAQRRQQFFAELYQTANDLEAERRTLVNRARLISLAEPPQSPAFPKRIPILAAGITLAALLAGFMSLKRDGGEKRPRAAANGSSVPFDRRPKTGVRREAAPSS